ncbi:hypothetical protein PENFLA_c053G07496 [Penicillium flavigenum]|uniref:Uncharacterized protein n=1 Tax=Penicillium flavigenum TaxID=254877 RepID=A0A1V6SHS6_9EURO|nr:hypothetical protein PENFLA_c053G07496 [Penicillium flavigenum]
MALKCAGPHSLFRVGYLAMEALNTSQHSSIRQLSRYLFLVYHESRAGRPNDDAPIIERVHHNVLCNNALLPRGTFRYVDRPSRRISNNYSTTIRRSHGQCIKYENFILMATLTGKTAVHLRPNGSATVDHLEIIRAKLVRRYYTLKDGAFFFEDQLVRSVTDNLLASLSTVQSTINNP